jgi:hypothetical protein
MVSRWLGMREMQARRFRAQEGSPLSDFSRWSRWLECGLELTREKTHAMAVMAWMAARASGDGSGIAFNPEVWASLADDIGLTADEAKAAVDVLIAEGLVTAVGQETTDRLLVRAVV